MVNRLGVEQSMLTAYFKAVVKIEQIEGGVLALWVHRVDL
jgi:hypothetical protein